MTGRFTTIDHSVMGNHQGCFIVVDHTLQVCCHSLWLWWIYRLNLLYYCFCFFANFTICFRNSGFVVQLRGGQWLSFQLVFRYSEDDSLLPAIPFTIWTLSLFCFRASPNPSVSAKQPSEKLSVLPSNIGQSTEESNVKSTLEDASCNSSTFST